MNVTASVDHDAIRVRFAADSAGTGYAPIELGRRLLLYRYDAFASGGATSWSLKLIADDGSDALELRMTGLVYSTGLSGNLTGEIDTSLGFRPLIVGPGRYAIKVDTDAAADGIATLWIRTS